MITFIILLCVPSNALRMQAERGTAPWGDKIKIPEGVKEVKINIGPNLNSIANPKKQDKDAFIILVEPLPDIVEALKNQFIHDDHVVVYQSAISDFEGKATFHRYNNFNGESSSLSNASNKNDFWSKGFDQDKYKFEVEVHTLHNLLQAIPEEIPITWLKTDMQGHDFHAIKSAGEGIDRVQKLTSEIYKDGKTSYKDVDNDYEKDWQPHMDKISIFGKPVCDQNGRGFEWDCTWTHGASEKSEAIWNYRNKR